jgi:hypothetical protein
MEKGAKASLCLGLKGLEGSLRSLDQRVGWKVVAEG